MKRFSSINLILMFVLLVSCQKEKIDSNSLIKMLQTVIDTSIYFDPALNEGDTLFIEFRKEVNISENSRNIIIEYIRNKYNWKIEVSYLDSLIKKDPEFERKMYLKNFLISVNKIDYKSRNTVIILTYKYKGMLAADAIETLFKHKDGKWICIESRIVSVS